MTLKETGTLLAFDESYADGTLAGEFFRLKCAE